MLKLNDIAVTQTGLSNVGQLSQMVQFVKNDGLFTRESIDEFCKKNPDAYPAPVIQISRFPDGKLYIADGHHRASAILLAGRDHLLTSEYEIVDWTYSQYMEINFNKRWVTPFDPRKEVRIPDYSFFKKKVYSILQNYSKEAAEQYILYNRTTVIKRRQVTSVEEMIKLEGTYPQS